jgi:hypothetical protein
MAQAEISLTASKVLAWWLLHFMLIV